MVVIITVVRALRQQGIHEKGLITRHADTQNAGNPSIENRPRETTYQNRGSSKAIWCRETEVKLVQTAIAFVGKARADEAAFGQCRGGDSGGAGPPRMHALCPGALDRKLLAARGHAERDALRHRQLLRRQTEQQTGGKAYDAGVDVDHGKPRIVVETNGPSGVHTVTIDADSGQVLANHTGGEPD